MMTAIDVLNATEKLLKEEGWGQRNHPGCLLNRMHETLGFRFGHVVVKDHKPLYEAAEAIRNHLKVQYLTRWNDERGRTVEDVFAAINGARQALASGAS